MGSWDATSRWVHVDNKYFKKQGEPREKLKLTLGSGNSGRLLDSMILMDVAAGKQVLYADLRYNESPSRDAIYCFRCTASRRGTLLFWVRQWERGRIHSDTPCQVYCDFVCLVFNGTSTQDRSICANCGRLKPTYCDKRPIVLLW